MQRYSIIGEIFGYLVCLLTIVIFFMSVAGIVNSAFRIANPIAGPQVIGVRAMGPHGGPGNFFFRSFGQRGGPGKMEAPPQPFPPSSSAPDVTTMRADFVGNARFDATRRLVLAIVMLILSVLVFRRAFAWLNPKQATGGGT